MDVFRKVAKLEALLERVRYNRAQPRGTQSASAPSEPEFRGPDPLPPSVPPVRALSQTIERLMSDEPSASFIPNDQWPRSVAPVPSFTSVDDFEIPKPARMPAALYTPPSDEASPISSHPPPALPAPVEPSPKAPRHELSPPPPSTRRPSTAPDLAGAVLEAVRHRDGFTSATLWEEAAGSLSRRPSSRPPPSSGPPPPIDRSAAEPASPPPPNRESSPDRRSSSDPTFSPDADAPTSTGSPLIRSTRRPRRRTLRPRARSTARAQRRRLVLIAVGVAVLGVFIAIGFAIRLGPTPKTPPLANVDADDQPRPTKDETKTPTPSIGSAAVLIASAPSASPAPPSDPSTDVEAPAPPPPDASTLPDDQGFLFAVGDGSWPVYINGRQVGDTNKWITTVCGFRYVRLAHRKPPSAGKSFPVWKTEGYSVMIPCGGGTTITIPSSEYLTPP